MLFNNVMQYALVYVTRRLGKLSLFCFMTSPICHRRNSWLVHLKFLSWLDHKTKQTFVISSHRHEIPQSDKNDASISNNVFLLQNFQFITRRWDTPQESDCKQIFFLLWRIWHVCHEIKQWCWNTASLHIQNSGTT